MCLVENTNRSAQSRHQCLVLHAYIRIVARRPSKPWDFRRHVRLPSWSGLSLRLNPDGASKCERIGRQQTLRALLGSKRMQQSAMCHTIATVCLYTTRQLIWTHTSPCLSPPKVRHSKPQAVMPICSLKDTLGVPSSLITKSIQYPGMAIPPSLGSLAAN
jgi:hypothetical protein